LADFSIAIGYRRGLSGCVLQNFTSLTLGQPVLSAVFPVPGLRIKHATADDSEAPNAFSSNSRPGTSFCRRHLCENNQESHHQIFMMFVRYASGI
jgi:hypothetical protein